MIRKALHDQTTLWDKIGHFDAIAHFSLLHGTERTGSPLPAGVGLMARKECFRNATLLSLRSGIKYAEGYAIREDLQIPMHHAWCVTPAGQVVDPTWRDPHMCHYIGIEIEAQKAADIAARLEYYSLLAGPTGFNFDVMEELKPGFARYAEIVRANLKRDLPPFLQARTVTNEDREILK